MKLVAVATGMVRGEIDLIEGARRIASLRHRVPDPDDDIFSTFVAVDSETDHLPVGEFRVHCVPEYVKKADEEIARYVSTAGPSILTACRKIIRVFARPTDDPIAELTGLLDEAAAIIDSPGAFCCRWDFDSAAEFSAYVRELAARVRRDDRSAFKDIWTTFAPTCAWDDAIRAGERGMTVANRIFELLEDLDWNTGQPCR